MNGSAIPTQREHAAASDQSEIADDVLIKRAAKGDRAAYGELVCRYRAGIVGVVTRFCGDPQLAEEAAQESFLRAWQRLNSFKAGHSFRAWVYRIAINAALDELRRDRPVMALDADDGQASGGKPGKELPDPIPGPDSTAEEHERTHRVRQAVMALPPQNRAALVLREYGGLSYSEIAAALDIPLGTVMSRLNAARAQLRKTLAELMEEE